MKNVLITGAARGIGKAISQKLSDENKYNIILNYNSSKKEALLLKEEIEKKGCQCLAIKADVSSIKEVKTMFKQIEEIFGGVDILINNSAISQTRQFQDLSFEDWQHIFDVNVNGSFNTIHCAIDYMLSQKNGVILNFSSIWGSHGASCEVSYSATKGAIEAMTKSLALEFAPSNIRVNAIAPGSVNTDMMSCYTDEDLKLICQEIPMLRMAQPKEIAELVSFLISDKNSYMTGQIISPNGGMCF